MWQKYWHQCCFIACLLVIVSQKVTCHVALTFPPARQYDLDFLDSVRTKPPCGMPKGGVKTSIKAGTSFNVTWHLGYPHQGGFRLELLDPHEKRLRDFTPTDEYVVGDTTAQDFKIDIPSDLECKDCTIRLVRQALEWGDKYYFQSCADVDIVKPGEYAEDCSGHGTPFAGRCRCNRNYYGHRCQFQNECDKHTDCGRRGRCVNVDATTYPKKQCFCQLGFFGMGCSEKSELRKTEIAEGLYTKREISKDYTLYWRVLPDTQEIEIAMKVKGTGYAAIGWRPKSITKQCQVNPKLHDPRSLWSKSSDDSADDKSYPEAEGESEPEGESESESEPEGKAEGDHSNSEISLKESIEEAEAENSSEELVRKARKIINKSIDVSIGYVTHSVSTGKRRRRKRQTEQESNQIGVDPSAKAEGDDSSEVEPEAESGGHNDEDEEEGAYPESEPETDSNEVQEDFEVDSEHEPESEAESESEPEVDGEPYGEPETGISEPEVEAESEAESEPEGEAESEAESEPEGEAESEPSVKSQDGASTDYTPRGFIHPMDCTDMVIGMARGDSARIWDYYTRDRSTPKRDTVWGGSNDLTAAAGWERDGETVIMFRKKLKGNGFTDHDITEENMHVIWAVGQEPGDYVHRPSSGLENGNPSIPDFYRPDELKYHGKKNRGKVEMNFYDEIKRSIGDNAGATLDFCGGEWKYPRTCNPAEKTCEYFARWVFDENTDMIDFTIQSKHTDRWTGIGFSDTPQMSLTDAVIGFVESNGRKWIMDMWTTGYLAPILENSQDLSKTEGKIEDGILTLKFSRPRNTNDNQDVAFTDDKGLYMIFPVKGGTFNSVNKKIKKHAETPIPSSERIFIKSCRTADGKITYTTTPRPAQIVYMASIKFVNLGDSYVLPVKHTQEYNELSNMISRNLRELTPLKDVSGFETVAIHNFKTKNSGEFIADFMVVVDKDEYDAKTNEMTIEKALKNTANGGRLGSLYLDPDSLTIREPRVKNVKTSPTSNEDEGWFTGTRLYIIIAAIAALVLVAVVQISCTCYKMITKRSGGSKDKLMPPSSWKDYAANGNGHHTNYAYDHFEADPRGGPPGGGGGMPPLPPGGAPRGGYHPQMPMHHNGSLQRPRMSDRSISAPSGAPPPAGYSRGPQGYSLPRPNNGYGGPPPPPPPGYGSYDRRGYQRQMTTPSMNSHMQPPDYAPDHYFMPSQRKYSGEVVRVFVDYSNNK